KDELISGLGPGKHFGEWWVAGIQRKYGLKEKRFSLFNTTRFFYQKDRPACCHLVPVLDQCKCDELCVNDWIEYLSNHGSVAAPGFMDPEGIVIYHVAGNVGFKKTI